ncbi:uncharacterized protein LOC136081190 [Hydra vulgaris]|uniref:Uncharacterized protein LOC136081190 n=1 Tax=Hydra vulgaris TaxID=6087 RepID=A0ABM4BZ92_HYDVU
MSMILTRAESVDSAFDFFKKCHVRLKEAGFTLRKFESNCKHLENLVNEQNFTSFNITKVLGLLWNKKEDNLIFDFRNLIHNDDLNPTKRKVLQFIASIFDPLGIVNPFIVKCKIFFQKLCIDKLNWDKPLEGKTLLVWQAIINNIKTYKPIIIPRWYHNHYPNQVVDLSLHEFSDASNSVYGCCIYLLCSFNDRHVSCSLITATSRIAQIKNTSIPRQELKAALLLAETMSAVKKELYPVPKFKQIFCWCDSTIVLHWINNTDKVKQPFFQKRIKKIGEAFDISHWRYIESHNNPADIVSRGTNLKDLFDNKKWFNGPTLLYNDPKNWPKFELRNLIDKIEEVTTNLVLNDNYLNLNMIDITRFNNYLHLLRVTALVLQFITNLKLKRDKKQLKLSNLDSIEIKNALKIWVMFVQRSITRDKNFKQLQLDLNLQNVDGIIRCIGRLQNAPITYYAKNPIFLPRNSEFTNLLINYNHSLVMHNGIKETLNQIRTQFWIPKARNHIKKLIKNCYICKRFEGLPYLYPSLPPLPLCRLNNDHAFKFTGVDYAGPFYVKNIYEGDNLYKVWIFFFTCATTRALFLDLVPDISAESCIRSLRRFFSKHGTPAEILSDNVSQFTSNLTQNFASSLGIKWHFNIPAAPWWGGFFERLVGSTKRCLRKIIYKAKLSYEELLTFIAEVESILNNRPITFMYESPGDAPLTPNHLIYGRSTNFKAINDKTYETNLNTRSRYIENTLNHYWQKWEKEYVTEPREFHKFKKNKGTNKIAVNDIVLIYRLGH